MTGLVLDAILRLERGGPALDLVLSNLSGRTLGGFTLAYTSITRTLPPSEAAGATLVRRQGNFHEYAPPEGLTLAPGGSWGFREAHLSHTPLHSNDGPKSAMLRLPDEVLEVAAGDLQHPRHMRTAAPGGAAPGVLPHPTQVEVDRWAEAVPLHVLAADPMAAEIAALAARLFPLRPRPFVFAAPEGAARLAVARDPALPEEGYRLEFDGPAIRLAYSTDRGLRHGLVTLAQMLGAAHDAPGEFGFPERGTIEDAPRHAWRGAHLDVARKVYPLEDVLRFVDILAWHKLDRFHWHLTDDEGWRLEIAALPGLTEDGAHAGLDRPILPPLGRGPGDAGGFFTQDDARRVVAHAAALGVEVMPEIDLPGHSFAALAACPWLADPDEPEGAHSVQGYANNALNPAMPEVWDFTETVLGEVCEIFPFAVVHVGGDEVAEGAWLGSPRARALMEREGLAGTRELQAHYLRRVHAFLRARGKVMGGWEEVAQGGGVPAEGSLLFAWTRTESASELIARGHDVVACPGEAYYLDMAQDGAWSEPGASWAGATPLETTYGHEVRADGGPGRLVGVQACIWSEHVTNRARFDHQAFPRLSAVAEAAWTPASAKDLARFAAVAPLMPRLASR